MFYTKFPRKSLDDAGSCYTLILVTNKIVSDDKNSNNKDNEYNNNNIK